MVTRKCDRKIPTVSVKSNYNVEGNFKIDGSLIVNGRDISSMKSTSLNGVSGDITIKGGNGINIEKNGKIITISSSFDDINVLKFVYCDTKPSVEDVVPNTVYLVEKALNFEAWMLSSNGKELKNLHSALQSDSGDIGEGLYETIEQKFVIIEKSINEQSESITEIQDQIEEINSKNYITEDSLTPINNDIITNSQNIANLTESLEDLTSKIEGDGSLSESIENIDSRVDETENTLKDIKSVTDNIDITIDTKISDAKKEILSEINNISFQSVESLPSKDEAKENVIYLISNTESSESNVKDEYIFIDGVFEKIGDSNVDLSGYVTEDSLEESQKNFVKSDVLNEYVTIKSLEETYVTKESLEGYVTDEDFDEILEEKLQEKRFLNRGKNGYMTLSELIEGYESLKVNTIYWVKDKSSIEQYIKNEDNKLMQISGNLNVKLTKPEDIEMWELPWTSECVDFTDNLPELVDGSYLFQNCTNLESFVSDTSNMSIAIDMFKGCSKLTNFNGQLFGLRKASGMFEGCKLSLESIENLIYSLEGGLPTVDEDEFKITIGFEISEEEENVLKELDDEAREKGWIVTWLRHGTEKITL